MSFRNRPVLDRKHRPRWQDELRTQQLVVAGFALAIAVAIGIFAAAAWSAYYDGNLRQVALVHGNSVQRGAMDQRAGLITAELTAIYLDLSSQLGGARDATIQQQMQSVEGALQAVAGTASESVVTGMVLDGRAPEMGISVAADELDAEIAERRSLPERRKLSLILVTPEREEGAPAGSPATDEAWAAAEAEAQAILGEIDGGADFATLAAERSDDQSSAQNGLLGWIEETDPASGAYFAAADDAAAGDVVGPLKNDRGWYLLKLEEVRSAGPDQFLADQLNRIGISDAQYREYVRQEMLRDRFRAFFASDVLDRYQPQREVAQIYLAGDTGIPVPKIRIRHLLAQPIPDEQDQSTATDEQWAAALARAEELREEADALGGEDWVDLAQESDDTGSASRGGFLGWYDPARLADTFVAEFAEAAGELEIGEISQPVRSQFGYHVIQVTERRLHPRELADRLVGELREDPDGFGVTAGRYSEDIVSAQEGGEVGWVIHYQYEAARDEAIFALTEPGEISDPIETDSGIYIFKLLDTSESRFVPQRQRDQVAGSGFVRWLEELKDQAGIWVDSEFSPSTAAAG